MTDYIPSRRAIAIIAGILIVIAICYLLTRRHAAGESAAPTSQSYLKGDIYPDGANARRDIQNALAQAAAGHKRVILDFGGNWCPDCRVLEYYFHDLANLKLLTDNYVLVPINIGRYDENTDLAAKYGIPLERGVPALAVLDSNGRLLYSQRSGEFENMRNMNSSSVTAFLKEWKP